jgi:hypothetical protein
VRRLLIGVALVVVLGGCGAPSAPTPTSAPAAKQEAAQPTPNVAGTVEAVVKATTEAAVKAAPTASPKPAEATKPAAPTAAPTATPATAPKPAEATKPAPAKTGAVAVEVTQYNHYKNSIGATVVQGMIENKGQVEAGGIDVAVSLISDTGATVGSSPAITKPLILKPGAKAGWMAMITGSPAFKEVRVQAQGRPATDLDRAFSYQDLKIDNATLAPPAPPFNLPKITGQATNTGSKAAGLITVIGTLLDAEGKVLAVDVGTTGLSEVAPGQSAPFEVAFLGAMEPLAGKKPEKYELFVQGIPK